MSSERLRGVIERITYHNEENGYTVAQLVPEGKNFTLPVIGNMLGIHVGESVEMQGRWTAHPQYGRQFEAENVRTVLPATIAGIEKYLGSGLIKGIGPVTAKRIVRHFGLDTLRIIEEEPGRLHEVLGVGRKRADVIAKAWAEQQKIKEVMLFLQSHNVSTGLAVKIYKQYGDDAINVVQEDPYRLARDIYGIGFITADKIAREMGIAFDALWRVAAGVAYVLGQAADEGNVYLPARDLAARAAELLGVSAEQATLGITKLADEEQVKTETREIGDWRLEIGDRGPGTRDKRPGTGSQVPTGVPGGITTYSSTQYSVPSPQSRVPGAQSLSEERAVYLTPFYYGEIGVANRLRRLVEAAEDRLAIFNRFDWPAAFATLQAQAKFPLTAQQQEAVQAALTHRVAVLTGGPGTGKCVTGDTLIRTATGLQSIASLAPADMRPIPDTFAILNVSALTREGFRAAAAFYYGGLRDTIRVTTREGYCLEGTPNHRIIVATPFGPDWKRLDELTQDDFVAIYREVPQYQFEFDSFAYFLGLFTGDGHRNNNHGSRATSVCITTADEEVASFIEGDLAQAGLSWSKIPNDPAGHAYRYTIGGGRGNKTGGVASRMRDWGETLGTSRTKTVPSRILHGTLSQQRAYLQGLFDTDGSAAERDGYMELTLSNEALIRTVQSMLLQFGIISMRSYRAAVDAWRLSVRGSDAAKFYERIGFRIGRKQARRENLPTMQNANCDLVPCLDKGLLRQYISQTGHHERKWWWQWKRECKGERTPSRRRVVALLRAGQRNTPEAEIIGALCDDRLYWAKIAQLEKCQAEVYDLSVPGTAEFIGNGFINHNTTTVRSVMRLAEAAGKRVVLASPTGRAAKRLSEATGRQAKTVHRLLEFKPGQGTGFQRGEDNPLEADLVIVDESSMLDLLLTNNLLKAVPPGAHLLFVGDIDQLPSVGAGNVLKDVIAAIEGAGEQGSRGAEGLGGRGARGQEGRGAGEMGGRGDDSARSRLPTPLLSGAVVVRLETIFRQPEGSYIIVNAHRINKGQMPVLDNQNARDFFLFKEEDPEKAASLIVDLVKERIPRKFALKPEEIQVLSPMHRGAAGVGELNVRLQEALNPARPDVPEHRMGGRVFRVGDRIMQIRNNYDKDIFNGDMGYVAGIDGEEQVLIATIDGRPVSYDFLELDELMHAYAISIHKAQGSEFPAAVIPLLTSHYMMLQRNLLYTGVTRAQRLVVLVGAPRAIGIAVRNNRAQDRYTGLAERLQAPARTTG